MWYLIEDVFNDILSYLNFDDLKKYRFVCNDWNNLIQKHFESIIEKEIKLNTLMMEQQIDLFIHDLGKIFNQNNSDYRYLHNEMNQYIWNIKHENKWNCTLIKVLIDPNFNHTLYPIQYIEILKYFIIILLMPNPDPIEGVLYYSWKNELIFQNQWINESKQLEIECNGFIVSKYAHIYFERGQINVDVDESNDTQSRETRIQFKGINNLYGGKSELIVNVIRYFIGKQSKFNSPKIEQLLNEQCYKQLVEQQINLWIDYIYSMDTFYVIPKWNQSLVELLLNHNFDPTQYQIQFDKLLYFIYYFIGFDDVADSNRMDALKIYYDWTTQRQPPIINNDNKKVKCLTFVSPKPYQYDGVKIEQNGNNETLIRLTDRNQYVFYC